MDRKEFIKSCGMACLGGTALAILLQSCAGQYYATSAIEGSNLKISLKEFTEDKKAQPIDRKYVLVKSDKLTFPIYLYKVNESQYSALWMECSHQGAELSAHGEYLTCPSHGSEFDKFGIVTSGPASKNLRSFKTTSDTQFILHSIILNEKIYLLLFLLINVAVFAQVDSTLFIKRVQSKDTTLKLNMDAVYNRPFLQMGKVPVALGGYVEANSRYAVRDGISEGLSFQMRRLTIFMSSSIGKRIKFLTEIEFEDGTKEINIEFAAVDVEFHPLFNLRGGIIMNPIGAFNQNHDGPKWEFIDRPISATTIIPSTFSNVGFGIWGKYYKDNWAFAYEAYLTNGFDDKIVNNNQNRTWLPATKQNRDRFEESFNGEPLVSLKAAFKHRKIGEIGVSWMGGVYNKFQDDGLPLDAKRNIDLFAVDFNTTLKTKTYINGEFVWAFVDVPTTFSQQFGSRQRGGFVDVVQPVLKRTILWFEKAVLNVCVRFDYADYNVGTFNETGENIRDDVYAVVPGVSFRPYPQTVLRANYRYHWNTDILGNPPSKMAVFQFGFSTYF